MSYYTRLTVESVMRDLARDGSSFIPLLMAPTGSNHYRAIIICRSGRTVRKLLELVQADINKIRLAQDSNAGAPRLIMGATAWFAPISTADTLAYCVEPISSPGRPQFKRAVKWLRKQGATTIFTFDQLDREATRHGLAFATKGRLDS